MSLLFIQLCSEASLVPGSLLGGVCLFWAQLLSIHQASAACLLLSLGYFPFSPSSPISFTVTEAICMLESSQEMFWILFILLFEKWSHVTQIDLKLYGNWGWPSTSNPSAYTSQVLGLWVWATTPILCSFLYARQALPTELQPQPSNYFINKLFTYKMFINILWTNNDFVKLAEIAIADVLQLNIFSIPDLFLLIIFWVDQCNLMNHKTCYLFI